MKALVALVFAAVLPTQALAEDVPCLGGAPGIFTFVKWDLKNTAPDNTDVTLTVHNATDQTFKSSEIKIRWGEWHQFFFKLETEAKPQSDVTFMNPLGMPKDDAEMLQAITPTLCAVKTIDQQDNKKYYE